MNTDSPIFRTSTINRQTKETQIKLTINIDGTGKHNIHSGLPFLDHMLTQIAVHGLCDIELNCTGDIDVDPHHTTEDIALAFGQAYKEALGDRIGIVRMASEYCPMDESLAFVALDFSGRPYPVIKAEWQSPTIGNIPATLFHHFFESFAFEARCTLHIQLLYGRDDHHKVEAMFKAFGRALMKASQIDPRRQNTIPSSKGVLF